MFLKKIEVFGFKSFMNKAKVDFGDGITCVIGPNGCGKSNISDAIRWVLGEQNPRLIRGESMDDVIFNGTRTRKPLGMAEVSLILSNEGNIFPIDYSEVRITRRLYRSGVSEYLLNKQNCRLKDIRDILMDTGLGNSAYTVMERAMTDQLLGNTSQNLRVMLEEAAGIMKYKTQEKLALRKLEATEHDLVRIRDIVAEVEKRVRSLKRQIGKANRFQELSDRIRWMALWAGRLELQRLVAEEGEKSENLERSRRGFEQLTVKLASMDASVESERLELRSKEENLKSAQTTLDGTLNFLEQLNSKILVLDERRSGIISRRNRLEAEVTGANERIQETAKSRWEKTEERDVTIAAIREIEEGLATRRETSSGVTEKVERARRELLARKQVTLNLFEGQSEKRNELGNLETSIQSLKARVAGLDQNIAAHDAENRRLEEQVTRATGEHEERAAELLDIRQKRDGEEDTLERLRTERAENAERAVLLQGKRESLEATLKLLCKLRDDYEGYRKGVQSLLTGDDHTPVVGVVGELVEVDPPEYMPAFENAIGEALQCVVVEREAEAIDLLRYLRDNEHGWATLLPRDRFEALEVDVPEDLLSRPGILGPASRFLKSDEKAGSVIRFLLGRVIFVESIETAAELSREERYRAFRFVTPSGEGARYPGLLFGGGSGDDEVGIFERRSRIGELESEREQVEADLERVVARKAILDEQFDQARVERDQLVAEYDRAVGRAEEASSAKQRGQAALEKGREVTGGLRIELEEVTREKRRVQKQLEAVRAEFATIDADGSEANRSLAEIEAEMLELEVHREQARKTVTENQVELANREGRLGSLDAELEALDRRERELTEEVTRKKEELSQSASTVEEIASEMEQLRIQEADLTERKEADTAARDEIMVEVNAISDTIRDREESARGDRRLREELSETIHKLEMDLQEIKMSRENLLERTGEEFEVGKAEILAAEIPEGEEVAESEDDLRNEVHELRESIRRIGPVNLVALDEFDEENERYEFLLGQESDLIHARDSLRETVATVDTKARTLYVETFGRVRDNFRSVFQTLFEGGEADLVLADDSNPLESDLEIIAKPGNKRPTRIALLSGGERALTAISVIFALYLEKPSPFCILDELDAPLDDANVGRFLRMVRSFGKKTQFVVITHNRQTMEAANYLYGVTMQESGVSKLVSVKLGEASEDENMDDAIRRIQEGDAA